MAKPSTYQAVSIKTTLEVCLGKLEKPVGKVIYFKNGAREFSQFAYNEEWLSDAMCIDISPDLTLGCSSDAV